jgi:hypothetical protein
VRLRRASRPWQLLVERLAVLQAAPKELRPLGHFRERIRPLGQEAPEIGMVPAEFVASAVAVLADALTQPLALDDELFVAQAFEVVIHGRTVSRRWACNRRSTDGRPARRAGAIGDARAPGAGVRIEQRVKRLRRVEQSRDSEDAFVDLGVPPRRERRVSLQQVIATSVRFEFARRCRASLRAPPERARCTRVRMRDYAAGLRAVTREVAASGLPYQKRQPSLRVATSCMPRRCSSRA